MPEPTARAARRQRRALNRHRRACDSLAFFNLLTSPALLETVEALLPEHRERTFPPTETLSLFLAQAMSDDGSCQSALNEMAVRCVAAEQFDERLLPGAQSIAVGAAAHSLPTPWDRLVGRGPEPVVLARSARARRRRHPGLDARLARQSAPLSPVQ